VTAWTSRTSGDRVEAGDDRGITALGDLERRERQHPEPHRLSVDVRSVPHDQAVSLQSVEASLHGASRDLEPPCHLDDREIRCRAQQPDQSRIQGIPCRLARLTGHRARSERSMGAEIRQSAQSSVQLLIALSDRVTMKG
jgi:hypothetical protein